VVWYPYWRLSVKVLLCLVLFAVAVWTVRAVRRRISRRVDVPVLVGTVRAWGCRLGVCQVKARDVQFAVAAAVLRQRDVGVSGAVVIPASALVHLGEDDWAVAGRALGWMGEEVGSEIVRRCAVAGWELTGAVGVELRLDPTLGTLLPEVIAVDPGGPVTPAVTVEPVVEEVSVGMVSEPGVSAGRTVEEVVPTVFEGEDLVVTGPWPGLFLESESRSVPEVRAGSSEDSVLLGRSSSADVFVNVSTVSAQHCLLFRRADGRWCVTDTGSTNGTFVNGVRTEGEVALRDGDRLGLGGGVEYRVR